ncbi:MAG: hypothetical protein J5441_03835 [Clostridia bacterium]|nr:hypothetical protein [Clostridia bacterium]
MKRLQKLLAAVIALLLIMSSLTAFSVFAEGEEGQSAESSSSAEESSSSSEEEKSSSSAEEKSSSSEEEKSSSSEEEKSSSSEEEESSSEESESSRGERRSSSSSSSSEEAYAQTITHDVTGITIGLSQPNDALLIDAKSVSADDKEYADIYKKLLDASKDKELVCCYEVLLGGDENFKSKVTIILPVDASLIGRSMVVLFYPERASHVSTSNKNVGKAVSPALSGSDGGESEEELAGSGVIRVSETLESGRKYYFAVCEFADFVPASNGFGLLEIMAILLGAAALVSGGLLAFLWTRYNKKQQDAAKK